MINLKTMLMLFLTASCSLANESSWLKSIYEFPGTEVKKETEIDKWSTQINYSKYSPQFTVTWEETVTRALGDSESAKQYPLDDFAEGFKSYAAHYGHQKYLLLKNVNPDLLPKDITDKQVDLLLMVQPQQGMYVLELNDESYNFPLEKNLEAYNPSNLPKNKLDLAVWFMASALYKNVKMGCNITHYL